MSTITVKDGTTIYCKDWGEAPVITFPNLSISIAGIDEPTKLLMPWKGCDFTAFKQRLANND